MGIERDHAELSRDADELYRDGFGFVSYGELAVLRGYGPPDATGTGAGIIKFRIKSYATAVAGVVRCVSALISLCRGL